MSLIGAGTEAATRTLLSVPVVVSNSIPDAGLVVLDKASVLSVYGQVLLATSTDFYFGSDNVALRATFRFGAAIADTERLVKLTVAGAGSSAGTSAPRPIRVVTEGRRFPGVASSVFSGGKSVRKLGARTWLTSTGLAMSRNRRGPKAIRSMLLHSPAVVPSTRI